MNCRSADRLYVRADGSVPCGCDVGENLTLFRPDLSRPATFDYARDCYNGAPFRELRRAFREGRAPYDICKSCYFFAPSEPWEHGEDDELTHIEDLQIESSFRCTVDCSACVPRELRLDPARSPRGAGPYELSVEHLDKLLRDLSRGGVSVGEFNFCGRGEPLLHPDLGAVLERARRLFPDSLYTAVTSGNVKFDPGMLLLDHVTVSIDGAFQPSYETYRKGGRIDVCFRFVRDVIAARRPDPEGSEVPLPGFDEHVRAKGRPFVRWKYLLFEHNDSDEELEAAQRLALEMGVDEMIFALSHTPERSLRYTDPRQIEELPIFRVFDGRRSIFTNVNAEAENGGLWAEETRRHPRATPAPGGGA